MASNLTPPPQGETPLTLDPNAPWGQGQWQGPAGGAKGQEHQALQDFYQLFGRDPTQSELDTLAPAYGGDPNIPNLSGGKAQVAAYFQQLVNSPQNVYKQQQTDLSSKAPQYYDSVNQAFQQNLGRDATDQEKTHFGMLLASGQDPYEIQQALQQTTEYQNKQTSQFTDQLKNQMQSTNADYFSKYILPSIQSSNAQSGRTQDSSGYQAQLANAAQGQNYDLQNYLAQVSAQGYQGSVANNSANYQALLGQQYGIQNANVSNTLANQAANTQYNQNLNMYGIQQQAYNNYLNRYGKTSKASGGLSGGLSGAASGAAMGTAVLPGWGTAIGGVLGGALGAFGGMQSARM